MANKPTPVDDLRARIDADLAAGIVPRGTSVNGHVPESAGVDFPPVEAYDDLEPGGFSDTDIANSKRFAAQHRDDVRYTAARGWFVWDGQRWAADENAIAVQEKAKRTALAIFDEVRIAANRDEIFRHAKRSQSKRAIDAMIALGRSEPGIPAKITEFDPDGWLFNVRNGTIDLRTGELRPHTKSDLITSLSESTFTPCAEYELWDSFLWRITAQNHDLYDYLRRFVGYLLVADTSDQSLHFLYGLGANGKSVFCEVLQRLMGDYAVTASPDLIMLRRHAGIPNDVARLRGVRAALMNETSQGSRFDEAKLKDLTGGDTLTARFLNHEFFDFHPTHRIIIRGNHKPAINGTDDGIWRRLRLVPFTVSIPLEEQDRDLLRKLRGELSGILNWAIQGCLEWQKSGLAPPQIVTDAVRQYREESDTLGRFIGECCDARNLAQVKSGVFFKRYQEYAQAAGERWLASKELPHEMQRRGFEWKRVSGAGLYLGISLKTSSENDLHEY
jgi:putative DNA primase/helicase